jgi:hypothetical protein
MIKNDTDGVDSWVLSGSICSWGDPLLDRFTAMVFLYLDPDIRMDRIMQREALRYGARIQPGGDMHQQHVEFVDWARSYDYAKAPVRSLDLHNRWMQRMHCPIIRLNSDQRVSDLCDEFLQKAVT